MVSRHKLLLNPNFFRPAHLVCSVYNNFTFTCSASWGNVIFRMHMKLLTDAGPAIRYITWPWVSVNMLSLQTCCLWPCKLLLSHLNSSMGKQAYPYRKFALSRGFYFRSKRAATCIDYSCAFISFIQLSLHIQIAANRVPLERICILLVCWLFQIALVCQLCSYSPSRRDTLYGHIP